MDLNTYRIPCGGVRGCPVCPETQPRSTVGKFITPARRLSTRRGKFMIPRRLILSGPGALQVSSPAPLPVREILYFLCSFHPRSCLIYLYCFTDNDPGCCQRWYGETLFACVREIKPLCRLYRASFRPEWRNWQTRSVQDAVSARTWGFESLLRHQPFCFSSLEPVPDSVETFLETSTV